MVRHTRLTDMTASCNEKDKSCPRNHNCMRIAEGRQEKVRECVRDRQVCDMHDFKGKHLRKTRSRRPPQITILKMPTQGKVRIS